MKTLTTTLSSRSSGFSLIELMITIAIIGLLSAIAYPSYVSYIEKGKRAECRSGLLKTMQQQERYFTQRNTYVTFATSTAVVSAFSGESLDKSACTIAATTCTDGSSATSCVELVATPRYNESTVAKLFFDSFGQKQCTLSASPSARVTGNTACWP